MNGNQPRCAICGRFVGIGDNNIKVHYTLDNEFWPAEIEHFHKACSDKIRRQCVEPLVFSGGGSAGGAD